MADVGPVDGRLPGFGTGLVAVVIASLAIGAVTGGVPTVSAGGHGVTTTNATLVVDDDGDARYSSIQAAVDDASDGDVVEVYPGTYREPVVVDVNVTLVAPRGATLNGSTFTDLSGEGSRYDGPSGITITRHATPVIRGFVITGFGPGVNATDTTGNWTVARTVVRNTAGDGIEAEESTGDWTVRVTTVRNTSGHGIDAAGSTGDWVIRNATVRNNFKTEPPRRPAIYSHSGVSARLSGGNWTIRGTTISDSTQFYIGARYSTGNWTVRNTTLVDRIDGGGLGGIGGGRLRNAAHGIYAFESTGEWTVRNTTMRGVPGVYATASTGDWTVARTVVRNSSNGLTAENATGDWTVLATTIRTTVGDGVDARDSTGDWRISNTTIENSSAEGLVAVDTSGNWTLRESVIRNSSADGIAAGVSTGDWTVRETSVRGSGDDALDARDSAGNWTVRATVLSDSTSNGIEAVRTTGTWTVERSSLVDNGDAAIDATDAGTIGDATHNWWGRPEGPTPGQCVGTVNCSEPLGVPLGVGAETGDRDGPTVDIRSVSAPQNVSQYEEIVLNVTLTTGATARTPATAYVELDYDEYGVSDEDGVFEEAIVAKRTTVSRASPTTVRFRFDTNDAPAPVTYVFRVGTNRSDRTRTVRVPVIEVVIDFDPYDINYQEGIQASEVLDVIRKYNAGEKVCDTLQFTGEVICRPVSAEDVLDVIAAYNQQ